MDDQYQIDGWQRSERWMTKIREMDGQDQRDGWPRSERWMAKIREMGSQDQRNGWLSLGISKVDGKSSEWLMALVRDMGSE